METAAASELDEQASNVQSIAKRLCSLASAQERDAAHAQGVANRLLHLARGKADSTYAAMQLDFLAKSSRWMAAAAAGKSAIADRLLRLPMAEKYRPHRLPTQADALAATVGLAAADAAAASSVRTHAG